MVRECIYIKLSQREPFKGALLIDLYLEKEMTNIKICRLL